MIELKERGMQLAQIRHTLEPAPESEIDLLSSQQFERFTERIVEAVREELISCLHNQEEGFQEKGIRPEK